MEDWHKKLRRNEESLREEGRQDRTREIVDFIRTLAEEEQSPGTVYHYMMLARAVSRKYLDEQEDDDG